jgi:outer membrane protein OmpA-like peptidoglycan-associated protein
MKDYAPNPRSKVSAQVMSSHSQSSDLSVNNNDQKVIDELSELRSLLLGLEPTKVENLYQRLDNPHIHPEDISRLLPEAILLRSQQDKKLGEAIVSTVEEAIQASVQQDENVLSEAFFPIIGPATRKAIAVALNEMMQSLNQTLEHSLSPESLKWRLEAKRTGKSFAEIVLLRSLVYRVEQVFLIHKQTGLLLQHLVATEVTTQDPDLVSAMLTAIQDFVQDSFNVSKETGIKSLRFGELTIWIEAGPQALLAGIIRGIPPQDLRLVFQEAIEKIHLKLAQEINAFTGDTAVLQPSKSYLEPCLAIQYKTPAKKNYTYAWVFLGTAAIACSIWGFFAIREQLRWRNYLQQLNSQPGIVVINTKQRYGKYYISGMRDPLAVDPHTLIPATNLKSQNIISNWQPYLSLESPFISKRIEALLQPPTTVSLQVDNNGILQATGSAPRQWILEARKLWRYVPGIIQFEEQNLVATELSQLESYKKQLEQTTLFFDEGTTNLVAGSNNQLNNLVLIINQILNTAKYLNKDVQIQIIGHTDITGTKEQNILLSQARANGILSYLNSQGINTSKFTAIGMSYQELLQLDLTSKSLETHRRVSFKVLITNIHI